MNRYFAAVILGVAVSLAGCAKDGNQVIDLPAFRPPSDGGAEASFRERLGEMSMTVFPPVVQTFAGTAYHRESRPKIAGFFTTQGLATVTESDEEVDLSKTTPRTQHERFTQNMAAFSEYLKASPVTTDYALLLEFLVTPTRSGGEAVGGVQCYLLDAKGNNAFSFLMNSHHRLFNEAELKTQSASDEVRAELIGRSTETVLEALRRQLPQETQDRGAIGTL